MDDDLDLSWIQEEQTLLEGPTQSKKINMSEIALHCIYVGSNQDIVSHSLTKCSLEIRDTHSTLPNECLLKYIKQFQVANGITYKIGEMMLYHVNVDFENLQVFLSCGSIGTFHPISMFEDVKIEPSLAIFHEVNEIYFIYQEKSVGSVNLVSILKNELTQKSNHTKKVRIIETPIPCQKKRGKHTRKKS